MILSPSDKLNPEVRINKFILLTSLLLGLSGCSLARTNRADDRLLLTPAVIPTSQTTSALPAAPPDATRGYAIYTSKCAPCHGQGGAGDGFRAAQVRQQGGVVANLAAQDRARAASPMMWYATVTQGRIDRLMPGFTQSLSVQDRWDALAYVWALGTTTPTLSAGQTLYSAQCASCHGAKGETPFGGANARLSDMSFASQNSIGKLADGMTKGAAHATIKLDEAQAQSVATVARSFAYAYADPIALQNKNQQGTASLSVQVMNLTAGGGAIKDQPVVLRGYDDSGETLSRTAQLNSSGVVTFTGLPFEEGYFYQAETLHQGGKFYAAPVQFTATAALSSALGVYDVATDAKAISISEYHYFVQDLSEGEASIVEVYFFDNSSNKAYMDTPFPNGSPKSLRVFVPEDAKNLRFDGPGIGARFAREGNTIYDSDAVGPGKAAASITLIYEMPYKNAKQIERQFAYPVASWDVLLPDSEMRATAPGLTDKGIQTVQNTSIRLMQPDQPALAANGKISFELTGQPRTAQPIGEDGRAIGLALMALAIALGAGFLLLYRGRAPRGQPATSATHESVLAQIAALDDDYEAGKLKPRAYQRKREHLLQLARQTWGAEK